MVHYSTITGVVHYSTISDGGLNTPLSQRWCTTPLSLEWCTTPLSWGWCITPLSRGWCTTPLSLDWCTSLLSWRWGVITFKFTTYSKRIPVGLYKSNVSVIENKGSRSGNKFIQSPVYFIECFNMLWLLWTYVSTIGPLFLIQYRDPCLCCGMEPVVKELMYSVNIFFSFSFAAYFYNFKRGKHDSTNERWPI